MEFWLSILPIILLLSLVGVFRRSIIFSAAITTLTAILIGAFVWGMSLELLGASTIRGILVALEIGLILVSALVIVEIIEKQKLFHSLQITLERLSGDYRVQTLLIGLALVYFIEGMAGFGTPIIVALPILVALGMKPLHGVIITLIAASVPGMFGGIGLPITYGVKSVLIGLTDSHQAIVGNLVASAAFWYVPLTMLLAVVLMGVITWLRRESFRSLVEIMPFTIIASLTISLPAALVATFVGPELPTAIGGLAGLILIPIMAHNKYFVPTTVIRHDAEAPEISGHGASLSDLWRMLWPYLLLILLLVISRVPVFGLSDLLQQVKVGADGMFGTNIDYQFMPLYAAPALLAVVAGSSFIIYRLKTKQNAEAIIRPVLGRIARPLIALVLVLIFVQIFINSNGNLIARTMPEVIAETLAGMSGQFWPGVAPFIGAMGSGVAGSTTMSNLIFSGLQFNVATALGISVVGVLLLQLVGAALGNMIALHNVIAALTVAKISHKDAHEVIKINFRILIGLVLIVGLVGFLLI